MTRFEVIREDPDFVTRLGTYPTADAAARALVERMTDSGFDRFVIERVDVAPDVRCYVCGSRPNTDCEPDCPNTEGRFAWSEGRDA